MEQAGQASQSTDGDPARPDGTDRPRSSEIRYKPQSAAQEEPGGSTDDGEREDLFSEPTRIDSGVLHQFAEMLGEETRLDAGDVAPPSPTGDRGATIQERRPRGANIPDSGRARTTPPGSQSASASWRPPAPGTIRGRSRVAAPVASLPAELPRASTPPPTPTAPPRSTTLRNTPPPPKPRTPESTWDPDDLLLANSGRQASAPLVSVGTSFLGTLDSTPLAEADHWNGPPPLGPGAVTPSAERPQHPSPPLDSSPAATRPWPEVQVPQDGLQQLREKVLRTLVRGLRTLASQVETFL